MAEGLHRGAAAQLAGEQPPGGLRAPLGDGLLNSRNYWTLSGGRGMFRGTEWYVMQNGRMAEVHAYDQSRDCQFTGFPFGERDFLAKA